MTLVELSPLTVVCPEDKLPLLGRAIALETPESFHARILALYTPRNASGKHIEAVIKGRKLSTATQKRLGIYELRYPTAIGEKLCFFEFAKSPVFYNEHLESVSKTLLCEKKKLEEFLIKKNFAFDLTSGPHVLKIYPNELPLEILAALPKKKAASEETESTDVAITGE